MPSLTKMEPEKLKDSIPKFKTWVSSAAWSNWEEFLKFDLPNLGSIPDTDNYCWPVFVLQAASDRRVQGTTAEENNNINNGEALEIMLDEERVPVEVRI